MTNMVSPRTSASRPLPTSCVEFSAPDVQEQARVPASVTDMWWVGVSRQGLTYEGTCANRSCLAWHEGTYAWPGRTACKKSMGSYRPNEDYDYSRVKCPACNFDFCPERYVFTMCSVKVQYRLAGSSAQTFFFCIDGDKHLYVLGKPGRQVVYTSMVLDVQAIGYHAPPHQSSAAAAQQQEEEDEEVQHHIISF
eukprot:TRINITY_DN23210_c0_g1_i1.p1 TRINITY_DN23210_c0_g1~~TRINITY_DN23210_c0_g1_i1.p1  ORF type:complete len:194 (-),score=8.88 TRINITY_DN23210_c0_g1_i1:128-709(-)